MILESVEHGPLIWPTVEENSVIRTKKYAELSAAEKIQADCDIKATNIILQGLPADIYSLVNHDRVAKDLWERVQLLMQGTSLTKQERECKLYNAFDKFTHIKGESLHMYYLRFTQLINDMNIYKMKNGSTIQVITKSLTVFHLNGFSDGTLTRILEALDYRVKEFKVKRLNPGMKRFWTEKDVPRSKEFIAAIERRLKTRRIYQNLECFVGGRVRDIDYRLLQRTE
ncbi:hypothetical protein Tco_0377818 [Tanacetum coccineum]